jgi:hypothetical protein
MRPWLAGAILLLAACTAEPVRPKPPSPLEEKGPPLADGTWFLWTSPADDPDRATTIRITREGVCTVLDPGRLAIRARAPQFRRVTFELSGETRDELSRQIERAQLARLAGREGVPVAEVAGFSCGTRESEVAFSVRMAIADGPGATHWIRRECRHPILEAHRHDWSELHDFCRDRILGEASAHLKR